MYTTTKEYIVLYVKAKKARAISEKIQQYSNTQFTEGSRQNSHNMTGSKWVALIKAEFFSNLDQWSLKFLVKTPPNDILLYKLQHKNTPLGCFTT